MERPSVLALLIAARPLGVFAAPRVAASSLYFFFSLFRFPSFLDASSICAASIIRAVAEVFSSKAKC